VDISNGSAALRYLEGAGLMRPDPTGDPIHFQLGGDSNGLRAPRSGYTPTLQNDSVSSAADNRAAANQTGNDNSLLAEQLTKLDRIAAATERQAQLSQQMLSYAS
jgi:hypothetical protein